MSSDTFPFIHILVDGLGLILLTKILLLSQLISVPYPSAVLPSLSVSCCSSSSPPPRRLISPANRKLQSGHPRVDTDDSEMSTSSASSSELSANWLFSDYYRGVKVFCIIFSRNMLNSTGDNQHPCHTPTVVQKKFPSFPFSNTKIEVDSLYNNLMTSVNQLSMVYSFKTCQMGFIRFVSEPIKTGSLWLQIHSLDLNSPKLWGR